MQPNVKFSAYFTVFHPLSACVGKPFVVAAHAIGIRRQRQPHISVRAVGFIVAELLEVVNKLLLCVTVVEIGNQGSRLTGSHIIIIYLFAFAVIEIAVIVAAFNDAQSAIAYRIE